MASITQAQYLDAALKLLPVGLAWHRSYDSTLAKLLAVRAEQLESSNDAAHRLIAERMPGNAQILLDDWEQFFGLPECSDVSTIAARREALKSKDNEVGSFNKYYLEDIARQAGYTIEVVTYPPHHCLSDCAYPLYPQENAWRVYINTTSKSIRYASCLDDVTTELVITERSKVECFLQRFCYAHVEMIFVYEEEN
ncbi:DUF2313 domain-containing protein [Gallibacterium salpingitidis]|uniref:putative phage tail protein n=1 Tax=Gallibacterium salpingitidis TaxID=505341 RepID=UPI002670398D|nr:putative phage tail protein [Gallibacterium salpingitidis]WKS99801.1 DUF2313 domain-containing protein [Gallibacterium salpingitidis]